MSDSVTLRDKTPYASEAMRVLYRFTKPDGHWAEIRERRETTFPSVECIVFVDGSLIEIERFHYEREAEYPAAIAARVQSFLEGDWFQVMPRTDAVIEGQAQN